MHKINYVLSLCVSLDLFNEGGDVNVFRGVMKPMGLFNIAS